MNPVLMLMYNQNPEQLELSKQSLYSVLAQDIPVQVDVIDNGSTCPFPMDFDSRVVVWRSEINVSPINVANVYAGILFQKFDHILGVPNDVILPANCYSELLKFPRGFVSATPIEDCPQFVPEVKQGRAISTNTPMCVMLTRKWAYDAIVSTYGYFFDPNFQFYASDCDLALRMAACGIVGVQTDVIFWHYRSATLRLAPPEKRREMEIQADSDRSYFQRKWGFPVTDAKYGQTAADINFRGISLDK